MKRLLLLTALAALALAAPATASVPKLDWKPCDDGFQCATVKVPLGFDARGAGHSRPQLDCHVDNERDGARSQPFMRPETLDVAVLVDHTNRYLRRCIKVDGEAIGHMSSADVARDLDMLRAAVGDKRLNYIGDSQGTLVGATYSSLFPNRVGRMVLDGFTQDEFDDLLAQLDHTPLGRLDGDDVRIAAMSVTSPFAWPAFKEALEAAQGGDGSALRAMTDQYYADRLLGLDLETATNAVDQLYPRRVKPFLRARAATPRRCSRTSSTTAATRSSPTACSGCHARTPTTARSATTGNRRS